MVNIAYRDRTFDLDGVEGDHMLDLLQSTGTFYEIDLLAYMETLDLPDGVIVDVGANIGNHAIFMASFLGPVTAFEPYPVILPVLKRNLEANPVDVKLFEVGLGAKPSRGALVAEAGNIGAAHIVEGDDVEIDTLDRFNLDVALMKVDVEGMELEVLQGAVETLKRCRPHLFLECGTRKHFHVLRAFLEPLGYKPVVRWAFTPVCHFAPQPSFKTVLHARLLRATRVLDTPAIKLLDGPSQQNDRLQRFVRRPMK